MTALGRRIAAELASQSDVARARGLKAYLKSDLDFFGIRAGALRSTVIAAERGAPVADRRALFEVVGDLWGRGVFELKSAAVELLARRGELVTRASVPALRELIGSSHTWALVDPLSTAVLGPLYERDPRIVTALDAFAEHRDFWIRRSAMLAHLPQLRRGGGDFARFARYADAMLEEREFFIRKAIGWVLRETSKRRPELVDDWLAPRIRRASGVTVREALKYLPPARKRALLAAFKARASA
jgi:3-methyladenine DNA glycosylase AlkD